MKKSELFKAVREEAELQELSKDQEGLLEGLHLVHKEFTRLGIGALKLIGRNDLDVLLPPDYLKFKNAAAADYLKLCFCLILTRKK